MKLFSLPGRGDLQAGGERVEIRSAGKSYGIVRALDDVSSLTAWPPGRGELSGIGLSVKRPRRNI
jgi:hypothetical protein